MAIASLTLSNGTVVRIEGTPQEVKQVLEIYSGQPIQEKPSRIRKVSTPGSMKAGSDTTSKVVDFSGIVNLVKDCDEAEAIETQILDKSGQMNRVFLPLYIVHEYMDNTTGLTSGEVSKVTTDLGIPISQPNASSTLSGTGSRYVMGDKVKRKGQPVRYKLSRRGLKHMKLVLAGKETEK